MCFMFWILFCIAAGQHIRKAQGDSCPVYAFDPPALMMNESSCKLRAGPDKKCYDCCPKGWNCCDNGSCMAYDEFCRYPTSCCAEQYCGDQCCDAKHGVPCGPICAPLSYSCCNSAIGGLCRKPSTCCGDSICCSDQQFCCLDDQCCHKGGACCSTLPGKDKCCPVQQHCCGDHCCPNLSTCCAETCCDTETQYCCDNQCCGQGEACCPTLPGSNKCCAAGHECCGDHCCPNENHEQCLTGKESSAALVDEWKWKALGEPCCPPERTCANHYCCSVGDKCYDEHCCADGENYCANIQQCCNGACLEENGYYACCNYGEKLCGHRCIPSDYHCCDDGDYYCSSEYFCSSGGNCCPNGYQVCGGRCISPDYVCCGSYYCDSGQECRENSGTHGCCPGGYSTFCPSGHCYSQSCGCCNDQCCSGGWSCRSNVCQHYVCHTHWWHKHCHWESLVTTDDEGIKSHIPQDAIDRAVKGTPTGAKMKEKPSLIRAIESSELVGTGNPDCTLPQYCKLPPPPVLELAPTSYDCFNDHAKMQDICFAFPCFETITHCGELDFLRESKTFYCDGVKKWKSSFTTAGQTFLTDLQQCVTQAFLNVYNQGITPCCVSLQTWGTGDMQKKCFVNSGFCQVFFPNVRAFENWLLHDGDISIYQVYFSICNIH